MLWTFLNCSNLTGTTYIHSTNISDAGGCFYNTSNALSKNVYIYYTYDNGVYTKTYNSFQKAGYVGTNTTGANMWNVNILNIGKYIQFVSNNDVTVKITKINGNDVDKVAFINTNIFVLPNSTIEYVVYRYGYVPVTSTYTVDDDTSTVTTIDIDTLTYTESPYTLTYNVDQTDAIVTSIIDDIHTVTGNTVPVHENATVNYTITKQGYKAIKDTITITGNETIDITMEEFTGIDIKAPFDATDEYLVNLVDGNNFIINDSLNGAISSGPSSYNKAYGTSYGYIKLDATAGSILTISCYTYAENNWDFGAIYVAKNVYKPTQSQIKNSTSLESGGIWLYTSKNKTTNVASNYSHTFTEDGTYYISFAYCKDSSGNSNLDRFVIESIKYE
jgi:hypothetical protein